MYFLFKDLRKVLYLVYQVQKDIYFFCVLTEKVR